jgi:hypothetical protein
VDTKYNRLPTACPFWIDLHASVVTEWRSEDDHKFENLSNISLPGQILL